VYFSVFRQCDPIILHLSSDPRGVNTTVEFAKIRQALTLIEAHVNYIQRSPASSVSITPSQPTYDAHAHIGVPHMSYPPLSLRQDPARSDPSEQQAAPGAQGQSNRSGFYAGPTSAASHLTLVCLLRVAIPRIILIKIKSYLLA
jgi:hypothetical protein